METDLVPRFSDKYESALSLLDANNVHGAKMTYKEMVALYSQISNSSLESVHKQLAYNCLVDLYNQLQSAMGFIVTAVILAILAVVLILKPGIVGLAAAELSNNAPVWTGDTTFKVSNLAGSMDVDLSQYFSDADNDELTFISTQTDNVKVEVIGDILTFIPKEGYEGTETVTVIGSDMKAITKVPVSVVIG
jgi:hypothetical protein